MKLVDNGSPENIFVTLARKFLSLWQFQTKKTFLAEVFQSGFWFAEKVSDFDSLPSPA